MENIYPLNTIQGTIPDRYETGMRGLDCLLSGGFVVGSTVLASGTTGAGKSTILLQIADYIANVLHKKVLYVSGEENKEQIKIRANRILVNSPDIYLAEDPQVEKIDNAILFYSPSFVVIDSLQMLYSPTIKQAPMTPTQMKNGLLTLCKIARQTNTTIVFIGHATKGGFIAGLQTLQHMVDTVMYIGIDEDDNSRFIEVKKNRFGEANITWNFIMQENGIHDDPRNYTPDKIMKQNKLSQRIVEEILKPHLFRGAITKASLRWYDKTSTTLGTTDQKKVFEGHPIWRFVVANSINWLQKELQNSYKEKKI